MPDHAHVLVSIGGNASIEKVMQLIKGGFSFRVNVRFENLNVERDL